MAREWQNREPLSNESDGGSEGLNSRLPEISESRSVSVESASQTVSSLQIDMRRREIA
jgi:hypothetical protein